MLAFGACSPSGDKTKQLAPAAASAEQALQEAMAVDKRFSDEAQTIGMAEAFAKYMDEVDGKLIGQGTVTRGADAIRAAFASWPADTSLTWAPDMGHASASGDLAVTSGRWARSRNGETLAQGRYVAVWRKNAVGQWKGVFNLGVDDPPPQPNTVPDPEGRPG